MLEIPILGRKISVRHVSEKELAQLTKEPDCLGFFDGNTIFICASLTQEQARRILLHELSHAILNISGLHNLLEDKQEEAICDVFESFIEVCRNKVLIKYLNQSGE